MVRIKLKEKKFFIYSIDFDFVVTDGFEQTGTSKIYWHSCAIHAGMASSEGSKQ